LGQKRTKCIAAKIAPYSINSSARVSSAGGTLRPIVSAS
jgi:hypothetical protein